MYGAAMKRRPIILVIALAILAIVVALPALAAEPSSKPDAPGNSGKAKKEKVEKDPITLSGTVASSTDAEGKTTYSIRSGGTTYTLEAGPSWFYGDNHPLKPFVGESVTIVGATAADSTEVDVDTVNGKALREGGKPPWAGGWKQVGEGHPGWSQEKADRFKAKFGDCFPPGQCKEKPNRGSEESEGTNPD
jgi:hypothetical protein